MPISQSYKYFMTFCPSVLFYKAIVSPKANSGVLCYIYFFSHWSSCKYSLKRRSNICFALRDPACSQYDLLTCFGLGAPFFAFVPCKRITREALRFSPSSLAVNICAYTKEPYRGFHILPEVCLDPDKARKVLNFLFHQLSAVVQSFCVLQVPLITSRMDTCTHIGVRVCIETSK